LGSAEADCPHMSTSVEIVGTVSSKHRTCQSRHFGNAQNATDGWNASLAAAWESSSKAEMVDIEDTLIAAVADAALIPRQVRAVVRANPVRSFRAWHDVDRNRRSLNS